LKHSEIFLPGFPRSRRPRQTLAGLPPTFIDAGTVDLFRDEDIAFATRLMQVGIPTELCVNPASRQSKLSDPAPGRLLT
jgi:acetyl esterase/lipase